MTDLPPPPPSFGGQVFGEQAGYFELSGWWRRVGAVLLDGLIVGVPTQILVAVGTASDSAGFLAFAYLVSIVGGALYSILLVGRSGQTVGKMATGIRVVDANSPQGGLGWGKAWGRYGAELAFGMGFNLVSAAGAGGAFVGFLLSLLLYLWPLWDARNQTWYDKAAGTIVIRA